MKRLSVLHWLAAAALAASLPVTARALSGHGMGGFAGGGPRGFMGGGRFMGGGPRGSMGPRFGGFGFRHDDRFFNHHRFVDHDRFFDHRFVDHNRFFFHHQNRFFFVFDFVSFGFPWGTPGTRLTLLTMGITPLTMATPTILPILAADRISITSIGLIWPRGCNRSLPGAAITTDRLTG
jgi:hypothetical protein